ncbi:MAG: 2-keto-4-pentenoate hydratase [Pirellulales bacterium]
MDPSKCTEFSNRLLEAERERRPVGLLSAEAPDMTQADAYAIARQTMLTKGQRIAGYKLGFTSQAMRQQMGIDGPNHGYLLSQPSRDPSDSLRVFSDFIHPRVETEIALSIRRDIHEANLDGATIVPYVDCAYAAIEIVDTRYEDYKFRAVDNIADNSSSASCLLGKPLSLSAAGDLRLVGALLSSDGKQVDGGIGANAMGNPLAALAWLSNSLLARGDHLAEGMIVLTGGITRAHAARAGQTFVAELQGMGCVYVHFS